MDLLQSLVCQVRMVSLVNGESLENRDIKVTKVIEVNEVSLQTPNCLMDG